MDNKNDKEIQPGTYTTSYEWDALRRIKCIEIQRYALMGVYMCVCVSVCVSWHKRENVVLVMCVRVWVYDVVSMMTEQVWKPTQTTEIVQLSYLFNAQVSIEVTER